MWYKNGEVFNSPQAIRNSMKETSLPMILSDELIESLGFIPVVDAKPIPTETQYIVEGGVELFNGVPTKVYSVMDKTAEMIEAEAKALVPQQVTPRQARLALLQATLLDEVEALLVNDKAMQIWWEYSLDIQRNHSHIVAMTTAMGMTELQMDELFILAGSL
jgi:hypothetical protein